MRRTSLAVALVLGAGLAGCLADEVPPPTSQADAPAPAAASEARGTRDAIRLEGCDEHAGVYPLTEGQAREHTPDGYDPAPGPLGAGFLPALEVYSRACEAVEGSSPLREIMALVPVEPPEEQRNGSSTRHLVLVWGATTSSSHAATYQAWGLPFREADLSMDRTATPAAGTWRTRVGGQGGTLEMTTIAAGDRGSLEGGSARIFGVDDGNVTGFADIEWTSSEIRQGQAVLSSDAALPVTPDHEGLGAHLWGFDEVWRPPDPPEAQR